MIPEYSYHCTDKSLVMPFFKKVLVEPLARVTPYAIPANIISIATHLFLYLGTYLALTYGSTFKILFFLMPLFLLIYIVGDHLDGMQAKRTGTGSPLGEFTDHFLDAFLMGMLLVMFASLFHVSNRYILSIAFFFLFLAHTMTIYHHYKANHLFLDAFSTNEGVVLLMLLFLAGAIEPVWKFVTLARHFGWAGKMSIADIFILVFGVVGFGTFFNVVKKVGISWKLVIFIQGLGVIGIYSAVRIDLTPMFFLFTLYGALQMGNILHARLVDKHERYPDLLVPALLLLMLVGENQNAPEILREDGKVLPYLLMYLGARVLWIAGNTYYNLRRFWVWKNHRP